MNISIQKINNFEPLKLIYDGNRIDILDYLSSSEL